MTMDTVCGVERVAAWAWAWANSTTRITLLYAVRFVSAECAIMNIICWNSGMMLLWIWNMWRATIATTIANVAS